jgi:hypothetical protein
MLFERRIFNMLQRDADVAENRPSLVHKRNAASWQLAW